jgi:hypothetical protein
MSQQRQQQTQTELNEISKNTDRINPRGVNETFYSPENQGNQVQQVAPLQVPQNQDDSPTFGGQFQGFGNQQRLTNPPTNSAPHNQTNSNTSMEIKKDTSGNPTPVPSKDSFVGNETVVSGSIAAAINEFRLEMLGRLSDLKSFQEKDLEIFRLMSSELQRNVSEKLAGLEVTILKSTSHNDLLTKNTESIDSIRKMETVGSVLTENITNVVTPLLNEIKKSQDGHATMSGEIVKKLAELKTSFETSLRDFATSNATLFTKSQEDQNGKWNSSTQELSIHITKLGANVLGFTTIVRQAIDAFEKAYEKTSKEIASHNQNLQTFFSTELSTFSSVLKTDLKTQQNTLVTSLEGTIGSLETTMKDEISKIKTQNELLVQTIEALSTTVNTQQSIFLINLTKKDETLKQQQSEYVTMKSHYDKSTYDNDRLQESCERLKHESRLKDDRIKELEEKLKAAKVKGEEEAVQAKEKWAKHEEIYKNTVLQCNSQIKGLKDELAEKVEQVKDLTLKNAAQSTTIIALEKIKIEQNNKIDGLTVEQAKQHTTITQNAKDLKNQELSIGQLNRTIATLKSTLAHEKKEDAKVIKALEDEMTRLQQEHSKSIKKLEADIYREQQDSIRKIELVKTDYANKSLDLNAKVCKLLLDQSMVSSNLSRDVCQYDAPSTAAEKLLALVSSQCSLTSEVIEIIGKEALKGDESKMSTLIKNASFAKSVQQRAESFKIPIQFQFTTETTSMEKHMKSLSSGIMTMFDSKHFNVNGSGTTPFIYLLVKFVENRDVEKWKDEFYDQIDRIPNCYNKKFIGIIMKSKNTGSAQQNIRPLISQLSFLTKANPTVENIFTFGYDSDGVEFKEEWSVNRLKEIKTVIMNMQQDVLANPKFYSDSNNE